MRRRRRTLCIMALAWAVGGTARGEIIDETTDTRTETIDERPDTATTDNGISRFKEVVVEAKKPLSSASSDEVREKDYAVRPHDTMMEILNNIPGMVVAQHQGGGKAPQWLVRGFDADHGTDFAVFADGMPVNMPTHAHGQGYADINFLIPETIEHFQLWKGPYFAQLGDFANAGALNFVTKEEFTENFAFAEGGSFDTQRYVVGASPKLSWAKTLLAAQVYTTNGPFDDPQHYWRYNVFSKFTLNPTPDSKLSLSGTVYDGDWDGSGQIPLRLVSSGQLDRFGSVDPTEGGHSDRENLDLHYTYTPTPQDTWSVQVYGSRYKLQLFSDFTFFRDTGYRFIRSGGTITDTCRGVANDQACPQVTGADYIPGDGIEQNDSRLLYGARANYTRYWFIASTAIQSQVGIETRNDDIDVALHRQVRRQRFYSINQLRVYENTLSTFMQHQVFLTDWLRIEAGLRGDIYFFDGENRLPNTVTTDDTCDPAVDPRCDRNFTAVYIAGNQTDSIVSPKVNVVISPLPDTDIYLNFGNGFHSNDARNVLLAKANPAQAGGTTAALARSTGYELGGRTRQFDRLDAAASLWLIDLESELTFSGDAGNQETGAGGIFQPSGPTRRWGVDFETRYQFTNWLYFDYDLSWADPRFKNGEAIPLAPTLLMNGGLTTEFSNGISAALRVRYLDDRPANEDRTLTARGYTLVDLLGRYRWHNVEAQLSLLNLTNTDWREAQFDDQSCVSNEVGSNADCGLRSPLKQGSDQSNPGIDGIHFTPGNPIAVRGGLTLYF